MSGTPVIIVEDYSILRDSYAAMIDATESFDVVGTYESCEEALTEFDRLQPEIVLMDISLPGISGIEGIKRIKTLQKNTSVVVITVHENSTYVFEALCAGAVGYITKSSSPEKLITSLEQVRQGGAPMSINIARMVVESFRTHRFQELTKRENEVLTKLAEGKTYATISDELFVSINTVKYHLRNIYEKLHVQSKEEAIRMYKKKS